jgi:tRNA threonylcarbamoyladenosine biosynthesis protein TsaE
MGTHKPTTEMTHIVSTSSLEETTSLGVKLGGLLRGGEVIELAGDLGVGKTVLVRGLARGLGYEREITSPTFTISRIYQLPSGLELHHFDFYRLPTGDIVAQELAEVVGDPGVIVAIEWAGTAGDALPKERLVVRVRSIDDTKRELIFEGHGKQYDRIVEGLTS